MSLLQQTNHTKNTALLNADGTAHENVAGQGSCKFRFPNDLRTGHPHWIHFLYTLQQGTLFERLDTCSVNNIRSHQIHGESPRTDLISLGSNQSHPTRKNLCCLSKSCPSPRLATVAMVQTSASVSQISLSTGNRRATIDKGLATCLYLRRLHTSIPRISSKRLSFQMCFGKLNCRNRGGLFMVREPAASLRESDSVRGSVEASGYSEGVRRPIAVRCCFLRLCPLCVVTSLRWCCVVE